MLRGKATQHEMAFYRLDIRYFRTALNAINRKFVLYLTSLGVKMVRYAGYPLF
jgi:hypothetical protein